MQNNLMTIFKMRSPRLKCMGCGHLGNHFSFVMTKDDNITQPFLRTIVPVMATVTVTSIELKMEMQRCVVSRHLC